MPSKIVWAKKKDIPDLLALINELAVYEKLADKVTATAEKLKHDLFGPKSYAEVILMQEDGKNVGFALFYHNYSTFLSKPGIYVEDIYVKYEFRKKGYGLKLLSYVAKIAEERGCGRMEGCVLDWNTPSINLYLSLGAEAMSDWTVHRFTGNALSELANVHPKTEIKNLK